jgi:tRNA(Arg) A34 adenosine deaminase TadA
MQETAFLDDGARRYLARTALPSLPARTAVVTLIQGIYECNPQDARRILRNRIFTTADQPTAMCMGMVRVAAKRLSSSARLEEYPITSERELIEISEPSALSVASTEPDSELLKAVSKASDNRGMMAVAEGLAERVSRLEQRYMSDRPIAALLVDADRRVLAWAINSNSRNKTLHAEVNLVQGYCRISGRTLPRGAKIFTTLKSCRMCAGMIWSAAEDPASIQVFFKNDDPGPMARQTVLTPGSHERRLACAQWPALRSLVIEFQLK